MEDLLRINLTHAVRLFDEQQQNSRIAKAVAAARSAQMQQLQLLPRGSQRSNTKSVGRLGRRVDFSICDNFYETGVIIVPNPMPISCSAEKRESADSSGGSESPSASAELGTDIASPIDECNSQLRFILPHAFREAVRSFDNVARRAAFNGTSPPECSEEDALVQLRSR
jgi:hypothetical protein